MRGPTEADDGQYWAEFYNAGPKFWEDTPKKFQWPKTYKI